MGARERLIKSAMLGFLAVSLVAPFPVWSGSTSLGTVRGVRAARLSIDGGKTWLAVTVRALPVLDGAELRTTGGTAAGGGGRPAAGGAGAWRRVAPRPPACPLARRPSSPPAPPAPPPPPPPPPAPRPPPPRPPPPRRARPRPAARPGVRAQIPH